MANRPSITEQFDPEQIYQIIEEYLSIVGRRQYVGARYVPIFGRVGEDSIEWDNTAPYEPITIVLYQGNSYTSRQYVPAGIELTNEEFWAETGNYNAQIEAYRREVLAYAADVDTLSGKFDDLSGEVETLIQRLAINVNPALNYEGVITRESVPNTYTVASMVSIGEDLILQIFESSSSDDSDGIYKFIQVGNGQGNRVLGTDDIINCGHANSAFVHSSKLYVLADGQTISVYDINVGTQAVVYHHQIQLELEDVGLIFFDEKTGKAYCGTTPTLVSGEKNITLYTLDLENGATQLFKSDVLPDTIAQKWPPLRNDCVVADGMLMVALTNATGNVSYNAIFVYDLENDQYCLINIPETCFAFTIGEIEGLGYDSNRSAVYLSCKSSTNALGLSCIIIGFCPFADISDDASYIAGRPNAAITMASIRLGTLSEGVSICQTGNSSTPATNLYVAVAMLRYQSNVLFNDNCYIEMLTDQSLSTNRLPDGDYHLSLGNKTLSVKSPSQGYVETGHGRHYINAGTIDLQGDSLNVGRESWESFYNVNLAGNTFAGGRGMSILSNVTNGTITVQGTGTADLIFRIGSTPAITT